MHHTKTRYQHLTRPSIQPLVLASLRACLVTEAAGVSATGGPQADEEDESQWDKPGFVKVCAMPCVWPPQGCTLCCIQGGAQARARALAWVGCAPTPTPTLDEPHPPTHPRTSTP